MTRSAEILVGVDGSVASLHALDWATQEARVHGLGLRLVCGGATFLCPEPFRAPSLPPMFVGTSVPPLVARCPDHGFVPFACAAAETHALIQRARAPESRAMTDCQWRFSALFCSGVSP